MKLESMIGGYTCKVQGARDVAVGGITYDSRAVRPGDVFVAVPGGRFDGHDFIGKALDGGAAAVVYSAGRAGIEAMIGGHGDRAWIGVDDCRDALAAFSASLYGHPSAQCRLIGLTGTNGKTTTSYLVKSVLETWGKKAGLIGTIRYMIGDEAFDAPHTTPEASDYQRLLAGMRDGGCSHVVSEVSSHALVQRRADHTSFRVAIFTNLTQDHLDFHQTMEHYFEAKTRLFTELLADGGTAVVNVDDPWGKRLCDLLRARRGGSVAVTTFSTTDPGAALSAHDIDFSFRGTSFTVRIGPEGNQKRVFTPLVGHTAVLNCLAAMGAGMAAGVPLETILQGLAALPAVKGRFERVDCGQPFLVVIDYAHTEDALARLLATARRLLDACRKGRAGRLITVFGCGGNRDRGKRPRMGSVASELSDQVIVTTDNPRSEDPLAIIRDIEPGLANDRYLIVPDRAAAIGMAVQTAENHDIVILAGKGHEDYQEVQGERHPFSDRLVAEAALHKRGWTRTACGEATPREECPW